MPKKHFVIRKEIKEQILSRLKNEGIPVAKLAEEHGISPGTIYTWLGKESTGAPSLPELAKLKRENQMLKQLIGHLTLQMEGVKKRRPVDVARGVPGGLTTKKAVASELGISRSTL